MAGERASDRPAASADEDVVRYVAKVTTLFHLPDRDLELVEGEIVDGLPADRVALLRNLGFVEPASEKGKRGKGSNA